MSEEKRSPTIAMILSGLPAFTKCDEIYSRELEHIIIAEIIEDDLSGSRNVTAVWDFHEYGAFADKLYELLGPWNDRAPLFHIAVSNKNVLMIEIPLYRMHYTVEFVWKEEKTP